MSFTDARTRPETPKTRPRQASFPKQTQNVRRRTEAPVSQAQKQEEQILANALFGSQEASDIDGFRSLDEFGDGADRRIQPAEFQQPDLTRIDDALDQVETGFTLLRVIKRVARQFHKRRSLGKRLRS